MRVLAEHLDDELGGLADRRRITSLVDGPQSGEAESEALVAAELAVFIGRVDSYAPEAFPERWRHRWRSRF